MKGISRQGRLATARRPCRFITVPSPFVWAAIYPIPPAGSCSAASLPGAVNIYAQIYLQAPAE